MSDSPALAVLVVLGLALPISTSSRWAEDGSPAPTSVATVTPDGPGPEPFRITDAGGSHTAAWRAVTIRPEPIAGRHCGVEPQRGHSPHCRFSSSPVVVPGIGTEQHLPTQVEPEQQQRQQRDAARCQGHRRPQ